ncbi:MAG TPA: serine hydrolase [Burkholderiales bacterium]|jgi:CubicO group peptidase (beta-lactamase class C family)|nr:serine hydrolase [Burkholderiales bacterium]
MNQQVTLANWRTAPFNRWGFQHVRELIPSADIPNDPRRVRELPAAKRSIDIRVEHDAGEPLTFERFLAETDTDGLVILHRGRVVTEHYANGLTPETPHILMSVSKSMMGLVFGSLGIDAQRPITDFVPEVAATAYAGATVRHLLDMRAGVKFDEDYLATTGPIVVYRKATGWNTLAPGEVAGDLHSFYSELTQRDGSHSGRFHYISTNSDLLGWVIERATGRRYADLASEHLWKPVGAERSAYITVDRLGAPRCAGGMCVTVRDLARVGLWMIEHPSAWIDDIEKNGDRAAWDKGSFVPYFPGLPIHYRSQWYVLHGAAPLIFGLGIHGQNLFIDRKNQLVIAKVSSQAMPLDAPRIALTMRAVSQLRKLFA